MHPGLRYAMMTTLKPFLDEHSELKIETLITNSALAVVDQGLDLVLHIGALSDSTMIARPLGWTRPVVCAAPAYLASRGEPHHPRDLAEHRAVIYARRDEASNTRWAFSRGRQIVTSTCPLCVVSRDGVGLVDAALSGCGLARPLEIAARHLTLHRPVARSAERLDRRAAGHHRGAPPAGANTAGEGSAVRRVRCCAAAQNRGSGSTADK